MNGIAKSGFWEKLAGPRLPHWLGDKNATHYQVLVISNLAAPGQIDAAFLKLNFTWNPLVCRLPRAEKVFARIAEAHKALSDQVARWKYDLSLSPIAVKSEWPALAPLPAHPAVAAYQRAAEWNLHGCSGKINIGV
jgi:hypothetical protein